MTVVHRMLACVRLRMRMIKCVPPSIRMLSSKLPMAAVLVRRQLRPLAMRSPKRMELMVIRCRDGAHNKVYWIRSMEGSQQFQRPRPLPAECRRARNCRIWHRRSCNHSNFSVVIRKTRRVRIRFGVSALEQLASNLLLIGISFAEGYTSISVREPLANIIAQTKKQNAQVRRREMTDSHYATVSDDSGETPPAAASDIDWVID